MRTFLEWLDLEKLSLLCIFTFAMMVFGGIIVTDVIEAMQGCPK